MKFKKIIFLFSIFLLCFICFTGCGENFKYSSPNYNTKVSAVYLTPSHDYTGYLETLQIYVYKNSHNKIIILDFTYGHQNNMPGWNFLNDFKYYFEESNFTISVYVVIEYENKKESTFFTKKVYVENERILFEDTHSNSISLNTYALFKTNLTLTFY